MVISLINVDKMGLIWSQTKVANYTLKKYCPLMKSQLNRDIFKEV